MNIGMPSFRDPVLGVAAVMFGVSFFLSLGLSLGTAKRRSLVERKNLLRPKPVYIPTLATDKAGSGGLQSLAQMHMDELRCWRTPNIGHPPAYSDVHSDLVMEAVGALKARAHAEQRELVLVGFGLGKNAPAFAPLFTRSFIFEYDASLCDALDSDSVVECLAEKRRMEVNCISAAPLSANPEVLKRLAPAKEEVMLFEEYFNPHEYLRTESGVSLVDMVVIVGRFRVLVALHLIPHIDERSVVIFADFESAHYREGVLECYEEVKVVSDKKKRKWAWLRKLPSVDREACDPTAYAAAHADDGLLLW